MTVPSPTLYEKHLIWSAVSPCGTLLSKWDNPISKALAFVVLPIDTLVQIAVAPLWTLDHESERCHSLRDFTVGLILVPCKMILSIFLAVFTQIAERGGIIYRMQATWNLPGSELHHQYVQKWAWLSNPRSEAMVPDDKFQLNEFNNGFTPERQNLIKRAFGRYSNRFDAFVIHNGSNIYFFNGPDMPNDRFSREQRAVNNFNCDNYLGIYYPGAGTWYRERPPEVYEPRSVTRSDESAPTHTLTIEPNYQFNLENYGILPLNCQTFLNHLLANPPL